MFKIQIKLKTMTPISVNLAAAISILGVILALSELPSWRSLGGGMCLFGLNYLLILVLCKRLMGRGSSSAGGKGGLLFLLLMLKVFLLGAGVFLGLIVFHMSAPYFVLGATLGLSAPIVLVLTTRPRGSELTANGSS